MNHKLAKEKAIELIEFITPTNYGVFDANEGVFENIESAIEFVNSDKYDPEIPLAVVFNTANGDYHDDARMAFVDNTWYAYDLSMGGLTGSGDTIQAALVDFRNKHDPTCEYYPNELIIKS